MPTLQSVFGNELTVTRRPRRAAWQYAAFAGAHGLTAMCLGSRGYELIVAGTLRYYGATYAIARAGLAAMLASLETLQWSPMAAYTYGGETYYYIVWDKMELVPGPGGKMIHYTKEGYATCKFVMTGTSLY